jgi:hypothetical protein
MRENSKRDVSLSGCLAFLRTRDIETFSRARVRREGRMSQGYSSALTRPRGTLSSPSRHLTLKLTKKTVHQKNNFKTDKGRVFKTRDECMNTNTETFHWKISTFPFQSVTRGHTF